MANLYGKSLWQIPMIEMVKASDLNSYQVIAGLADEIWREHYTAMIGTAQVEYMLAKFQSAAAIMEQVTNGAEYYLITLGQIAIGYLAFQVRDSSLFLSKIYVKSTMRGQGIGRLTIGFLEKITRDHHLNCISLTVNKINYSSIKAYEQFGFQIVRALVQDIGNGFVMDDYEMRKNV
ncbi:MAG: GNAT family N-acetyltransferase [Microcoleaceae cyanobacterium]